MQWHAKILYYWKTFPVDLCHKIGIWGKRGINLAFCPLGGLQAETRAEIALEIDCGRLEPKIFVGKKALTRSQRNGFSRGHTDRQFPKNRPPTHLRDGPARGRLWLPIPQVRKGAMYVTRHPLSSGSSASPESICPGELTSLVRSYNNWKNNK